MNTARQRVLDMLNDADGDLLTNDAPYAQTLLTDAWTWLQDRCADAGVEVSVNEITLYGLPARNGDDPGNQSYVTWQGCSDGVNQYDQPALPQNVISPIDVYRRTSGSTGGFVPMRPATGGLARFIDPNQYDWRANGFYYYGDTSPQDLLFRFSAYFEDLDVLRPNDPVPIRGCKECLGSRIGFMFTNARQPGSPGASSLEALSEAAFEKSLAQRASKRKQRQTVRRRGAFSGRAGNPWPFIR